MFPSFLLPHFPPSDATHLASSKSSFLFSYDKGSSGLLELYMWGNAYGEWQLQKCESMSLLELLCAQVRYCVLENTIEREIPASMHTNKDSAEKRQSPVLIVFSNKLQ
jgi:hypothetical protein